MKIFNRRAKYDYELLDRFEAGIALVGAEVKAARQGQASLVKSYAKVIGNEAYLVNATINIPGKKDYEATRTRKLLLHRKELNIISIETRAKNLTLIPLKMYTKGHLIKLELALAKSKRKSQKRESLKIKDIKRDIERELKER